MNVQLPMFAFTRGQEPTRLLEVLTQSAEDLLEPLSQLAPLIQDDSACTEKAKVLDPFEVLGLDPLLADVSPDATGIMSGPAWSAVFATHNLLDLLSLGTADRPEVYEGHLYNVICRARLELDLVSHAESVVRFYFHTETADLRLALVIRDEFQPHAAVIGLADDF
jgi:hypothetical protein